MPVVEYKVPENIDAAVSMLSNTKLSTKVMAGGTDLIIQSRAQSSDPLVVIDIKRIYSSVVIVQCIGIQCRSKIQTHFII